MQQSGQEKLKQDRDAFRKNRDRGFLTKKDRKFLRGELDYSDVPEEDRDRQITQTWYRIRKRFLAAIYDMELMANAAPRDEILKAVDMPDLENTFEMDRFENGVMSTIQLIWLAASKKWDRASANWLIERAIAWEIMLITARNSDQFTTSEVTLDIKSEHHDIEKLKKDISGNENMNIGVGEYLILLKGLWESGRITSSEFEDLLPKEVQDSYSQLEENYERNY